MENQNPNQNLLCPHCRAEQDGIAADFVILGNLGKESMALDNCVECDKKFMCEAMPDGSIKVTAR